MGYKLEVYLDNGLVFKYELANESSVREHAAAIAKWGYRHNSNNVFEHYPPHRILKIKCCGSISTKYPDFVRGT